MAERDDGGIVLVRLTPEAVLNLRGRPGDVRFVEAAEAVLGIALPPTPNRCGIDGDKRVFRLGPDEWLLAARDGSAAALESALRGRLAGDPWFSAVDLSHGYTGFRLAGRAARDVLAKGCTLDLHPSAFGPGHAAQTLLARSVVLLSAHAGGAFEIRARNSFGAYLSAWLEDAMQEFSA